MVRRWSKGSCTERSDLLACEEPLEIRVRGRNVSVTLRTPGYDQELAAGFLLSEGIIRDRRDVVEVAHCEQAGARLGNTINVFLSPKVKVDFDKLTRHVFASSSCGLCGKATIDAIQQQFPPIKTTIQISTRLLEKLPDQLRAKQAAFAQTGGLHAAAIFDSSGRLVVLREDVGRHNAVDKVIGHGFLKDRLPFDRHILLVSGRASFEIMQKALSARIPVVAAISAPSSLAVEFAQEGGQTLVGFLRGDSMNVYTNPDRITG
ncbi:MAG: formate dehydrogenase accessory sulfurtransferase FdhD [Pedosphaera sp.]|nr:formate dehydrogenase accessory sulfurtransferase FdhD [Pedosphaera sp.]